jgi:hypothetical protein
MRTWTLSVLSVTLVPLVAHGCATPSGAVAVDPSDPAALERSLRAFVDERVAQGNAEAAKQDGQTFVQLHEERRVLFFVPAPEPEPEPKPAELKVLPDGTVVAPPLPEAEYTPPVIGKTVYLLGGGAPPDDAARGYWTDRYALAQQFRYRWAVLEIGPVMPVTYPWASHEAKVVLRLECRKRSAVTQDLAPLPQPPQGMVRWTPTRGGAHGRFFGMGAGCRDVPLPTIPMPGRPAAEVADPLAGEAVAELAKEPEVTVESTLSCQVLFHRQKSHWCLSPDWPPRVGDASASPLPEKVYGYIREPDGSESAAKYPEPKPEAAK